MKKAPLISVVMPVYGVEDYLENSVKSVLNQTFEDFELILVDDESPDNCPKMCDDYAQVNSCVRVTHQKNKGLGGARNTGLYEAEGQYVYFLDSDDTIQPDTLEYFDKVINDNEGIDMVFSDFQYVNVGDEFKAAGSDNGVEILSRSEIQRSFLLREKRILAPATCYRRVWLLENNLHFEKIPYSEDQHFLWNALLCVNQVAHIRKPLYNYLVRPGSIMNASTLSKIVKGYPFFKQLDNKCQTSETAIPLVRRFLLSRWVIGILHSSARLCSFEEYQELCEWFEAERHCKNLRGFPSKSIAALSYLFAISPKLFFRVLGGRKIKPSDKRLGGAILSLEFRVESLELDGCRSLGERRLAA